MEFKKVLSSLIKHFDERNIRYGLIGGFALVVFGIPRTTIDLDFLVDRDDLAKLDKIMAMSGYRLAFRTENVSQYVGLPPGTGEIDFVHAFRKYSKKMLVRVQIRKLGDLSIRVLRPENIVGLKVQAIANDPTRKNRELADIESILDKFGNEMDWSWLEEYFELFDLLEDFRALRKRYGKIDRRR